MSHFQNKLIGSIGENLAKDYLIKKGYQIVTQNFHTRFGEIDLIAQDKDILVFVEVKTKVGLDFGSPEAMFTPRKYDRVKRMATIYLKGRDVPCRIDLVAIVLNESHHPISINHYQNPY
jgi:putative endonuclease